MADDIEHDTFIQCKPFLEETIDPDSGLLDKLLSSKALSRREICDIKSQLTFHKRNSLLLQYIIDKNKHDCLISALRDTRQEHLVNYLNAKGEYQDDFEDEWPLREAEISILDTNQGVLVDLITPAEFVSLLFAKGVINRRQRDEINSKEPCHKKNEALLEILRRCSLKDFKVVIQCLHETNQNHIAIILEQGGAVVKVHVQGLDNSTEDKIINSFYNVLRNIPIEESERILQGTLIALTKGQSIVLYIYCRKLEQLMQLKEAQANGELKKSVQRLFTKLRYHTQKTKVTVEKLNKIAKSMFTRLFKRSKFDEISVTLPMKEYDRVGSYFPDYIKIRAAYDFNPNDVDRVVFKDYYLQSNFKNSKNEFDWIEFEASESENSDNSCKERLNNYIQPLSFKKGDAMKAIPPINIGETTTWWKAIHLESEEVGYVPRRLIVIEYQRHFDQKYETSSGTNQAKYLKSATSNTSMNLLPFELLDSILQKSYLKGVLKEEPILKNQDYHAISQMASVDCCWFQRIRRRKFKKELRRSLIVFYRRREKLSSISRINRQYLEENIQLQCLVNRLKSYDFLTDVQAAFLYRQNLPLGKKKRFKRSRDLASDILIKIGAKHYEFRRCLYGTNQHLIAEVIRCGGATVKVTIKFRRAETSEKTRHQNFQIVERINKIRKTTARSYQIQGLMAKQKLDDLEILSAGQDGDDIVLWIWCKTKCVLERLQTLNKSKDIIDIFTELIKNLPFSPEERISAMVKPEINIDFEQFERTVVSLHREFLVDRICTEFGLLDKLFTNHLISYNEIQTINEAERFYNGNQKLLEIIIKRNKQDELIEALKTTGQAHLVNYLKTDGKYNEVFGGDWPLNDYEIKILQKNSNTLVDLYSCDLLSHLFLTGVIKGGQRDFVISKPTSYKKNETLLDIIIRSSLNVYRQTIKCLRDTNQSHIAEILETGGDKTRDESFDAKTEKPTEENILWDEAMRRHREFLVDRIFTEFGLLDKLCANASISYKEMQKISESGAFYERNRKLLDIIIKRNKQHELIEALKTSGQIHLINFLKTDGKNREVFGDYWPLSVYEIKILKKNCGILVDLFEMSDLLSRLYSTGVINRRQRNFINSKPTPYEKNEALLDILRRSSLNAYRQTIRCLHASNQSHIAEFLKSEEF